MLDGGALNITSTGTSFGTPSTYRSSKTYHITNIARTSIGDGESIKSKNNWEWDVLLPKAEEGQPKQQWKQQRKPLAQQNEADANASTTELQAAAEAQQLQTPPSVLLSLYSSSPIQNQKISNSIKSINNNTDTKWSSFGTCTSRAAMEYNYYSGFYQIRIPQYRDDDQYLVVQSTLRSSSYLHSGGMVSEPPNYHQKRQLQQTKHKQTHTNRHDIMIKYICEVKKDPNIFWTDFYPHSLQQLYRCYSWWKYMDRKRILWNRGRRSNNYSDSKFSKISGIERVLIYPNAPYEYHTTNNNHRMDINHHKKLIDFLSSANKGYNVTVVSKRPTTSTRTVATISNWTEIFNATAGTTDGRNGRHHDSHDGSHYAEIVHVSPLVPYKLMIEQQPPPPKLTTKPHEVLMNDNSNNSSVQHQTQHYVFSSPLDASELRNELKQFLGFNFDDYARSGMPESNAGVEGGCPIRPKRESMSLNRNDTTKNNINFERDDEEYKRILSSYMPKIGIFNRYNAMTNADELIDQIKSLYGGGSGNESFISNDYETNKPAARSFSETHGVRVMQVHGARNLVELMKFFAYNDIIIAPHDELLAGGIPLMPDHGGLLEIFPTSPTIDEYDDDVEKQPSQKQQQRKPPYNYFGSLALTSGKNYGYIYRTLTNSITPAATRTITTSATADGTSTRNTSRSLNTTSNISSSNYQRRKKLRRRLRINGENVFMTSHPKGQEYCIPLNNVLQGLALLIDQWRESCYIGDPRDPYPQWTSPLHSISALRATKASTSESFVTSNDNQDHVSISDDFATSDLASASNRSVVSFYNWELPLCEEVKSSEFTQITISQYRDFHYLFKGPGEVVIASQPDSTTKNGKAATAVGSSTNSVTQQYAICDYLKDPYLSHTNHFPHAMQQLYRCWSWWNANRDKRAVLTWVPNPKQWERNFDSQFLREMLEAFQYGFNVTIMSNTSALVGEHVSRVSPKLPKNLGVTPFLSNPQLTDFAMHTPNDAIALTKGLLEYYGLRPRQSRCRRSSGGDIESSSSDMPRVAILNRSPSSFRHLLNYEEIIEKLEFEIPGLKDVTVTKFDYKSLKEQVDFFSNVDILISGHGAQLTGIPFMSPQRGGVLEVFPRGYYSPHFFGSLAYASGLNHGFIYETNGNLNSEVRAIFRNGGKKLLRARQVNLCPPVDQVVAGVKVLISQWRESCSSEGNREYPYPAHAPPSPKRPLRLEHQTLMDVKVAASYIPR